jgi:hypothetical protein
MSNLLQLKTFRELTTKDEILTLILNADPQDKGFFWQTRENDRVVYPIHGTEVDLSKSTVSFSAPGSIDIHPDLPVHIKLNPFDFVFKVDPPLHQVQGHSLEVPIPTSGKALENRKNPRIDIAPEDKYSVTLRPTNLNASLTLDLIIIDLSKSGMGFLCDQQRAQVLRQHRSFWLEKINHVSLVQGPILRLAHISPTGKMGELSAGFSLEEPWDDLEFSEFLLKHFDHSTQTR